MLSLNYEYRVIPAPRRAIKAKSIPDGDERFAFTLAQTMNEMGRDGWEYVRADTLPMDERAGLAGTKTSFMNMLVFRRVIVRNSLAIDPANEDFDSRSAFFEAPAPLRVVQENDQKRGGTVDVFPENMAAE